MDPQLISYPNLAPGPEDALIHVCIWQFPRGHSMGHLRSRTMEMEASSTGASDQLDSLTATTSMCSSMMLPDMGIYVASIGVRKVGRVRFPEQGIGKELDR